MKEENSQCEPLRANRFIVYFEEPLGTEVDVGIQYLVISVVIGLNSLTLEHRHEENLVDPDENIINAFNKSKELNLPLFLCIKYLDIKYAVAKREKFKLLDIIGYKKILDYANNGPVCSELTFKVEKVKG